jgi:2-methylcitrate dehydratase PrpD
MANLNTGYKESFMAHETGVTSSLSRLVARTRWDDTSEAVRHQAKRSLMNFFAVALFGCRTPPIELLLASLAEFSSGRCASVIGREQRMDALSAAFLNAAGANVFDFCDTHVATAIHPTATAAAALLALGEWRGADGQQLLLGLIVGQEVACRVGLAISPSHYARGWHITSSCGVLGAAAACASLLRLQEGQSTAMFGIAATQFAGLCECLGTGAKSVSVGNAARNGLWSALLAERGLDGPAEPLTGAQGLFNALSGPVDLRPITEADGWEILKTSYKPYPCGFVIHPVLDCVLDWRRENPRAGVVHVLVRGNPLLAVRADRPAITSGRESQVSVQHAVAAALIWGKAGLEQFNDASVLDPRAVQLRSKVKVESDASIGLAAASVQIETEDGRQHLRSQAAARGSDGNPLSDADLEKKLREAGAQWRNYDVEPLIDSIWTLDRSPDTASLLALAVPR